MKSLHSSKTEATSNQQPSSQTNIPTTKDATQNCVRRAAQRRYVMGNAGKKRYLGHK
jgi:hypothetical protein